MRLNKIAKKSIVICSVLLLILSLNISPNVSARLITDEDYGVAYDEFDTDKNITCYNCNFSKGSIKLEYEEYTVTYDRDETPDNIKAWKIAQLLVKPGDEGVIGFLSKFLSPNTIIETMGEEFSDYDYTCIWEEEDNKVVETEALIGYQNEPNWPMNLFRFEIDYDKDIIDQLTFDWTFGDYKDDANLEEITMYAWSYGDLIPNWNYLNKVTYNIGRVDLSRIEREESCRDFISNEGIIDVLIVGNPKEQGTLTYLYSDYVNLSVTIKKGYLPNGNVTSSPIKPLTINGWEQVIWSGSRPTVNTYVKIKVLDQYGDEIPEEDLEGNSDGFTSSPIDISSLNIDKYPKIKLKALLHSENLKYTPRLNSWAVLWQTKSGFYDNFKYNFRINESYGVKIDGGEITVNEFYSDWPIFGKNPANTRAYVRPEATFGKNETYWYTSKEKDIGGGFRSPVVSNGKVYVASSDNKIYAFNLKTGSPGKEQSPISVSKAKYKVDASVAVADDLVIVATSILDNRSNKVYALDSTNLYDEKWHYPEEDSSTTICFSSAPTIANGRVFITSWSGKFSTNPMLSYLYSKLATILREKFDYDLGVNNKLIALDLDGNEIWDPINLPASSFSTPAVDNGLVFVGCENLQGPSLFAFDEYSGEEVWNASVGLIGRSSPVVVDGKVFVLSREQPSILSIKGNDKVFALDAETGEEIWNVTIRSNTTVLGNVLKGYGFDNLMATSSPVSTPALYEDTLVVMSIQGVLYGFDIDTGEEKWNFNVTTATPGIGIIPYYCASPAVVNEIVYIAASKKTLLEERAFIFAIDSSKDEEILWDYELRDPEYDPAVLQYHYIFASPVVVDGMVLISERRWDLDDQEYHGRIQCIGEYKRNLMGEVYSVPIHVQKGKWWNEFNAVFLPTDTTNNTVTFSILDENGNELMSGLNGTHNNISAIKGDVIQLCADLTISNTSQDLPVLKSWEIDWTIENKKPEFIASSFEPGQGGWINLELEKCSIEVRDFGVDDVISGLDTNSAKFELEYIEDGDVKTTGWLDAETDGEPGAVTATVIANLSATNIDVADLRSITFKIKDLARNEGNSSKIEFQIDPIKPTSEITNKDDIEDNAFKTEIVVNAEAVDPKNESDINSGVSSVALKYRHRNSTEVEWGDWKIYAEVSDYYNWSFGIDVTTGKPMDSGYYQIITIAKDKAGNEEDFVEDDIVSFLFDMNMPSKPIFKEEYRFNTIPEFSGDSAINFSDDFQLKSVDYRLNFHGPNEWINISDDDINDKNYTGEWSLTQEDWDIMLEDVRYYMYFRITDICGNQYETRSDDEALNITKDVTPPIANVTLDLSDFEEGGWDDAFTITADVPDDAKFDYISLEYSYSADNSEWSEWTQYGESINATDASSYEWEFKAEEGSGYYKFKTKLWDAAGNVAESPGISVNITLFPTALVLIMIILIVILLVITVFVVKKIKKKKE